MMAEQPKSPDPENIREYWKTHLDRDSARPFASVSENLLSIGALTVDQFLHSSSADSFVYDNPEIVIEIPQKLTSTPPLEASPEKQTPQSPSGDGSKDVSAAASNMKIVAVIHETCQRAFGTTEALKFEFLEENGPRSKQCILTITRPNGVSRSYATEPIFSRKNEAKAQVAAIAVEMGAIDFIFTGDANDSNVKNGLVLAPLDAPDRSDSDDNHAQVSLESQDEDCAIKEIEECFAQWRAGLMRPQWIPFTEPKILTKHGYALRVRISKHCYRVYSCDSSFASQAEAKKACAQIALDQGVLDFIKFGNGQNQPMPSPASQEMSEATSQCPTPTGPLTLQKFYDALPQPFPESFEGKTAAEINAPGWLNSLIQSARGGKLFAKYIWISDNAMGLHGCLLRIDRPGESKSYLVDPRFARRVDAKAAVGLQAISEGVGSYIRAIGEAALNKLDQGSRTWAKEHVIPTIVSEFQQIRPGCGLSFVFPKERDAYGCTLKLDLCDDPSPEETRTYTVPIEYRAKADARIAVACLAAEEGAIEFLKFRGQPPPADWVPFVASRDRIGDTVETKKRKDVDRSADKEARPTKKSKIDKSVANLEAGEIPSPQSKKEESMACRAAERSRDSKNKQEGNRHKGDRRRTSSRGAGMGHFIPPAHVDSPTGQYPLLRYGDLGNMSPEHPSAVHAPHLVNPSYVGEIPSNPAHGWAPGGHLVYGELQRAPYQNTPLPTPPEPFQGLAYPPAAYAPPPPMYYQHSPVHSPSYSAPYPQPPPPPPSHVDTYSFMPGPYPQYSPYPPDPLPYQYQTPHPHPDDSSYPPPPLPPPIPPPSVTHKEPPRMPRAAAARIGPSPREHPPASPVRVSKVASPSPEVKPETASATTMIEQGSNSKPWYTALLNYCKESGLPTPHFNQDVVAGEGEQKRHQVWVIMGKERLELPVTYPSAAEGRERLAKQVLARLKGKKRTIKA